MAARGLSDHSIRISASETAASRRLRARSTSLGAWLRVAVLLLPSLLVLLPFFFAPLATMLAYSFYRFVPGAPMQPDFIPDNYLRFITDAFYRGILLDTLLMGLAVTLLSLVLSYPLAYTVARSRSKWKGVLVVIVLLPLMTSVVVRSYGWMILLANNGVINSVLVGLGLEPARLMFNFTGTVVALTEVLMPFMVLTLLGVIQQIDPTLEEAVRSLGGSRWRVFRDVVLPMSLPGIAAGSLLVFALSISAFATPRLVGGASTKVMATVVYDQTLNLLNWPFAAAISFILMVLVLALTAAQGWLLGLTRRWVA
jgi:putative spermidine/putrescine transport system permease protein